MESPTIPTPEITPQPISSPLAVNPPKKSYLPLILAVIIIFAVSIFGGVALGKFLYGPQSITPQPTIAPKPTIIPTATPTVSTESTQSANWKTYTNTKYAFSFKYPPNATTNENLGNQIIAVEYQEQLCPAGGAFGCAWFVRIYGPTSNPEHNSPDKFATKDIKIAGIKAIELIDLAPGASPAKIYDIQSGNNTFTINVGVFGKEKDYQKIIDQILSTFRFD